ncbi:MAG: hypothetical protein ACI9LN_003652, partial [Saprospiraceae bacterium]
LLRDDLKAQDSFIKSFKLENYVKRFLNKSTFKMSDYDLLARVYYIATLIVYHKQVLGRKK